MDKIKETLNTKSASIIIFNIEFLLNIQRSIMSENSYHIQINYRQHLLQFEIKAYHDSETNSIQHDVWQDGTYYFTLIPVQDYLFFIKWKDKNTLSGIDEELVEKIGEAIESHDF